MGWDAPTWRWQQRAGVRWRAGRPLPAACAGTQAASWWRFSLPRASVWGDPKRTWHCRRRTLRAVQCHGGYGQLLAHAPQPRPCAWPSAWLRQHESSQRPEPERSHGRSLPCWERNQPSYYFARPRRQSGVQTPLGGCPRSCAPGRCYVQRASCLRAQYSPCRPYHGPAPGNRHSPQHGAWRQLLHHELHAAAP